MKGIMIQGCSSDAGKSFIATAICRVLSNKGYLVCPFKSQNMSNNSYVTADGGEIGRAQGEQARAARQEPTVFMNPILLKPQKTTGAEIILFGQVYDSMNGREYQQKFTMNKGLQAVDQALEHIRENFELIVIEGAGSPAEINLNDREIVNMRIANRADVPVLLVVDVNRGGSFASVVGTLELVGEDRQRIKGIIFNNFRGDVSLFADGAQWIEDYTGIKVVGIMPHLDDVILAGEDSLSINFRSSFKENADLRIGVISLPYISNHTDMEAFLPEDDLEIFMVGPNSDFSSLDGVIIPGTKSTMADMAYLEESGMADKIKDFAAQGGFVFGICGGYQILGQDLIDPLHIDGGGEMPGLGLLDIHTQFADKKRVIQVEGCICHSLLPEYSLQGYEIHMGLSFPLEGTTQKALLALGDHEEGLATADLRIAGSYMHNIFHNDLFRNAWLNLLRRSKGLADKEVVHTSALQDENYEKMAQMAEQYLDMDYLFDLIFQGGADKN